MQLRATRLMAYGRGRPAWTPSQLTTALWLDADDASTITLNGSTVSQWNDKSGNRCDVSQSTASNQPTYSAAGFNNKPTLVTDGTDFLQSVANSGHLLRNVSEAMFFMVAEHNGATSGSWYFVSKADFATRALFQNQGLSRLSLAGRRLDTDTLGSAVIPTTMTAGQQFMSMLYIDYANAQVSHYLDSVINLSPIAFQTAGSTSNTACAGFSVFANFGGANPQPANAKLSELILVNQSLSVADRQRMEGYLAWKWGGF